MHPATSFIGARLHGKPALSEDTSIPNRSAPRTALSLRDAIIEPVRQIAMQEISAVTYAARVVLPVDNGPLRSIITGRRRVVTGSYASRKARRALPFESMHERALFMHSEVDTSVVDYLAQPLRIELARGKQETYIADLARLRADGSVEIVEVKSDPDAIQDDEYQAKLEAVQTVCARLGWSFQLVFGCCLTEDRVRYRNICEVQQSRFVNWDTSHAYSVLGLLDARGGEAEFACVAEAIGGGPLGEKRVKAMMVDRLLAIELARPLSEESRVSLIQRACMEMLS